MERATGGAFSKRPSRPEHCDRHKLSSRAGASTFETSRLVSLGTLFSFNDTMSMSGTGKKKDPLVVRVSENNPATLRVPFVNKRLLKQLH